MYTIFFISFVFSSTCFGCYLHPSSGAQLQHTTIVCVSVEHRGFSIKRCGGSFCMDLCVLMMGANSNPKHVELRTKEIKNIVYI
jgi:hypothetical protein